MNYSDPTDKKPVPLLQPLARLAVRFGAKMAPYPPKGGDCDQWFSSLGVAPTLTKATAMTPWAAASGGSSPLAGGGGVAVNAAGWSPEGLTAPLAASLERDGHPRWRQLLAAGAAVNWVDAAGCSPLAAAVSGRHSEDPELLVVLLRDAVPHPSGRGAAVNIGDEKGVPPLLIAMQSGRWTAAGAVLDAGAHVFCSISTIYEPYDHRRTAPPRTPAGEAAQAGQRVVLNDIARRWEEAAVDSSQRLAAWEEPEDSRPLLRWAGLATGVETGCSPASGRAVDGVAGDRGGNISGSAGVGTPLATSVWQRARLAMYDDAVSHAMDDGHRAATRAAAGGHVELVTELVAAEAACADTNAEVDHPLDVVLELAAATGADVVVADLLSTASYTPTAKSIRLAQRAAAAGGHVSTLVPLLDVRYTRVFGRLDAALDADEDGNTALHLAAAAGHSAAVAAILKSVSFDAYAQPRNAAGRGALHEAAAAGHTAVAAAFAATNSLSVYQLRVRDGAGRNAYIAAAAAGHASFCAALAKTARGNVFVGRVDGRQRGALHAAAAAGHADALTSLLRLESRYVSSGDLDGATPLHLAAAAGHEKAVEVLFRGAANVAATTIAAAATRLHVAAEVAAAAVATAATAESAAPVPATTATSDARTSSTPSPGPAIEAAAAAPPDRWQRTVGMLLSAGANAAAVNAAGRTPAAAAAHVWAAERGGRSWVGGGASIGGRADVALQPAQRYARLAKLLAG